MVMGPPRAIPGEKVLRGRNAPANYQKNSLYNKPPRTGTQQTATTPAWDLPPHIHPGRLRKYTPLEIFQEQGVLSQGSINRLKRGHAARYHKFAPGTRIREKRHWEHRMDG